MLRSEQAFNNPPARSLFYALGLTDEEMKRPLIGVASAYSEIVPGHIHLDKVTEAVKAGISCGCDTGYVSGYRRLRRHRGISA